MKYLAAMALAGALLFSSACTQSSEKLVEAGNRYHTAKKYKEASILYQKALTKDKTNAEAYYREGLNLLDMGQPVQAISFLRRAVDLKPSNTEAETKLAEIYLIFYSKNREQLKSTLLPEIKELVDKVQKYQPNSFNSYRLQGLLDLVSNDRDKALDEFEKANNLKPYSPEVVTLYAESLYNAKRVDEAIALERGMLAHDPKWGAGYDFLFLVYSAQKDNAKIEALFEQRVKNDPTNEIAIRNLANYQMMGGHYDAAEATIKRVLADPKTFPNGHQMVGDFYFGAKKFDQAIQEYEAGVKADPKNAVVYEERLVNLYQDTNRHQDALNLARSLAKDNPKNLAANQLYASLLLQTGSPDAVQKSLSDLQDLVKTNPTDPVLHIDLARAYFDTNDKDKSLAEAQEAEQDEIKQAQAAQRQPNPQIVDSARIISGRIYEDRGQHAKAIEQANLIIQNNPKNPSPDARLIKDRAMAGIGQLDAAVPDLEALVQQYPKMALARLALADIYVTEHKFDQAAAQFDEFSKQYPSDLRGIIGTNRVLLAQGKADQAVSAIQSLVDKQPKDLQLRYQLATFQAQAGIQAFSNKDRARGTQLFQASEDNYKEILKTTANSSDVWLRLGVLQRELGQTDAALASFDQSANADPHNSAPVLNKAMLLESLGKTKDAMTAYNKVLGIDPENPLAMNNLAFLNAQEGTNLDQAMTYAERAKQKLPDSPDISDTLGYVYYQKNLNSEALQIFKDLVAAHQTNPTFLFHLALALNKSGNKDSARDEARKALQLSTQPDQQNQIKSFLSQLG